MNQESIDFYWRNGYYVHGPLLDDEQLAVMRQAYDEVIATAQQQATGRALLATDASGDVIATDKQQVYQVMNGCERSIHFRKLLYHGPMLDVVSALMGPNIMLFHDQLLFKPPHTGGPVPWHQDNGYWKVRPATLMSCWITLDDVVEDSGAMRFIPASHLQPVWHDPSAAQANRDALLNIPGVNEADAAVVELPAGACVFHHCQTLHSTKPNTTDRQRRAFAIHFMPPGSRNEAQGVIGVGWGHPMLRASV